MACNPPGFTYKGCTPIHIASYYGQLKTVEALKEMEKQGDLYMESFDLEHNSPIHYAAKKGHTDIVKFLMPYIEEPNMPNKRYRTILNFAAEKGFIDTVKIITTYDTKTKTFGNKPKIPVTVYNEFPRNLNSFLPIYFATQNGTFRSSEILDFM